jgi:hypothetical protein
MEIGKIPVGNINIDGLIYEPKKDITTYELAILLRLFICIIYPDNVDAKRFIVENNLLRHFKGVE